MKNSIRASITICFAISLCVAQALAAEYYVSPQGDDASEGTREKPFRTIQHAADKLQPGDTCIVREGRYRETVTLTKSGTVEAPIVIQAALGEKVVIDGTDPVNSAWKKDGKRFTTKLTKPTVQLFCDSQPMMLARFPNMIFSENWIDEKKWARTNKGSKPGMIVSEQLAKLNASLVDARLFIKVGKGNNCFSRKILKHTAGGKELKWDDADFYDLPRNTAEDGSRTKMERAGLHNNRFFICDHPALLDAKQEWYWDAKSKKLSFLPPSGAMPKPGQVTVKQRADGVIGSDIDYVSICGIEFFACSATLERVRNLKILGCHFFYPYELLDMYTNVQIRKDQHPLTILGENCLIEKCLVIYSTGTSIAVSGRGNRIENSVVTEGSRHGRHNDPNVMLHYDHRKSYPLAEGNSWKYQTEKENVVTHCTIYNCSGIGIGMPGVGPENASFNHIFNVGLYCTDVSGLYIPLGRNRAWSGFDHNWLHDINGIGLRVDRDGDQVLFHHNVVWNCISGGKLNGYACKAFHNTIFVDNPGHPLLLVKQDQDEVVSDWEIQNNVVFRLADRAGLRRWIATPPKERKRKFVIDVPDSETIHHNYIIKPATLAKLFVNPNEEKTDLRPMSGSLLVDAGVPVDGINKGYKGKAPDIGAYELGGKYWVPGADWLPGGERVPKTMPEATALARRKLPGLRLYKSEDDKERYKDQ